MRKTRVYLGIALPAAMTLALALAGPAGAAKSFRSQVSPSSQTGANEPSVAVDRSDGTIYVAWQGGTNVARSDDGGHTWVQTPLNDQFSSIGDVDVRVGGPTPCSTGFPEANCKPGAHRVYVSSIPTTPDPLQTQVAYSDDRGANWTINKVAAFNPSFIDRPWIAVYPSKTTALKDQVYLEYHDFSASQINVAASNDGGQDWGPSVDVLAENGLAEVQSFCDTIPSGVEVDPRTGDVYVLWITADPANNTTQGCNISQIENFHQVWVAHSSAAVGSGAATLTDWTNDAHLVFDGGPSTNTDVVFATLAVDDSGKAGVPGNVYAVFPDNLKADANEYDVWLARSGDKARTWTTGANGTPAPVQVSSDTGRSYFPWIAAGSTGRVDFIWLHTNDTTPTDSEQSPWKAVFGQTTNGTASPPTFFQTAVSGVMHVGGICTNGIFCTVTGGNRDLADSISIAIDRGGAAAAVWSDQGTTLNGPTHIEYACIPSGQPAYAGANKALACRGPAS